MTGLIYAAIVIAWLAYLVPTFVRRPSPSEESNPANQFATSMRIIARGTAPLLDQDLAEISSVEVSTPLTRRAAIADLRRLEHVAAERRRRVLVALLLILSLTLAVCALHRLPWWSMALPSGLVLGFIMIARVSVRGMRRHLDRRYANICAGGEEATVLITRTESAEGSNSKQTISAGVLWEPVPITMPTYVSKPLAPRTVRTIDLSGPEFTTMTPCDTMPPTADPQPVSEDEAAQELAENLRKAAGA